MRRPCFHGVRDSVRATMRCALIVALTLFSFSALAQDDDLPALPSAKPKPKPNKPKPKPKPKQAQPAAAADDDLPALPAQKGDLVVRLATPMKGAKLTIDDKEIGPLPQGAQSLTAGDHTVTVRRLGFAPFSKKVAVAPNKGNEVVVTLEPSAAVLTVSSDVAGAQVFINNRLAGTAPLIELEVPPGNVDISVRKDGYHDGSQTLNAKAGRDYPIEVKLGAPITSTVVATKDDTPVQREITPVPTQNEPPITGTESQLDDTPVYQKWWFWTGVVVVVAAVAVGSGIAASSGSGGGGGPPLREYGCHTRQPQMMCDGWVNMPSAIVPMPLH